MGADMDPDGPRQPAGPEGEDVAAGIVRMFEEAAAKGDAEPQGKATPRESLRLMTAALNKALDRMDAKQAAGRFRDWRKGRRR